MRSVDMGNVMPNRYYHALWPYTLSGICTVFEHVFLLCSVTYNNIAACPHQQYACPCTETSLGTRLDSRHFKCIKYMVTLLIYSCKETQKHYVKYIAKEKYP